ncbi:MAG: uracil-DNA glycosylase [Proteobacteria bacterium]|nr:uracil-DNA glycosylase [Pseudomonadota bacterium]MBU1739129.1 uracil-DNA glycosylase [Pseudomonadota bacterium]
MAAREIIETIKATRDRLVFLKDMGIKDLPLTPELKNFLADKPPAPEKTIQPAPVIDNRRVSTGNTSAMATLMNRDANPVLEEIYADLAECTRCPLHLKRRGIIPGQGEKTARLLIIEDQPSENEEAAGVCVAGAAGELLDKMLKAIHLDRSDVYITSIVKCRPENDRLPTIDEINTCLPFLARQVAAVNPAVIFALGPLAARTLTGNNQPLFRIRGKFHDFHGTSLMASFHPTFLLKNEEMKKASWIDLQLVQKKLAENSPAR